MYENRRVEKCRAELSTTNPFKSREIEQEIASAHAIMSDIEDFYDYDYSDDGGYDVSGSFSICNRASWELIIMWNHIRTYLRQPIRILLTRTFRIMR